MPQVIDIITIQWRRDEFDGEGAEIGIYIYIPEELKPLRECCQGHLWAVITIIC